MVIGYNVRTSGNGWYIYTVDEGGFKGGPSLALNSNNYPHIIGTNQDGWYIHYARWNGSEWEHFDKIYEENFYPTSNSMVLDSEGSPHICYYAFHGYYYLKYATLNGTKWDITDIDYGDSGFAISNSIDIDSQNNPHVAYTTDYYSGHIKYAKFDGYEWEKETVDDTPESTAEDVDFALDANGYPHIAYYDRYDEDNGILRYARWNGEEWENEIVDDSAHVGCHVSLDLDDLDHPHISYVHKLEGSSWWYGNIKYAYRDEQNWITEYVTTGDTVGWGTSIRLDSQKNPHIAYIDGGLGSSVLIYTSRIDGNWDSETVASGGPTSPSLVLDLNDKPHISYCDRNSENLSYATTVKLNCSPDTPEVDGPINGKVGVWYDYNFSLSDPDGDSMDLRVDWGIGGPGKLHGPFDSGTIVTLNYSWRRRGTYSIRAQAIDVYGAESEWATLEVTMPKNQQSQNMWYLRWLDKFPLLQRLLSLPILNSILKVGQ